MCQQSVVAGVFLWAPHTVSIVVAILFSSHSQCCLFNLHAVCFKSDCQHVHWCVCVSLIVGSLNISGWSWFWKGKVNVFWLCVSVCICVNLFVCPSHVSVVGHGWIRRVTKKRTKQNKKAHPLAFPFPLCMLWGTVLNDAWLCCAPHRHPTPLILHKRLTHPPTPTAPIFPWSHLKPQLAFCHLKG